MDAGLQRLRMVDHMTYTPAQFATFRGCLAYNAADLTTKNYTAETSVTWDSEAYDTDAIHSTSSNTSRMTVPSGVTKVRLAGVLALALVTSPEYNRVRIFKNGAALIGGAVASQTYGAAAPGASVTTPVLSVTAGDYFELMYLQQADTSITVQANQSCFALEIIE
jgi:hypothetical protein